nr:MAG TPA_asm: hypothetical protein [Caudoviricetes sp.]
MCSLIQKLSRSFTTCEEQCKLYRHSKIEILCSNSSERRCSSSSSRNRCSSSHTKDRIATCC